jgi:Tol biopolymer transport system component
MKKKIFALPLLFIFTISIYAQPEAAGEPKVIAKMNEPLRMPVWSSDGTKLFLTSLKNNGIWEVSSDGSDFRQISAETGAGNRLKSLPAKDANFLLQEMVNDPAGVTGRTETLKSLSGLLVFNPVLSPQGDRIVFQVSDGKGMYICNADGSNLRKLGNGERAAWTPDGRYIVVMFVEDNGEIVTKGELVGIDVATGEQNVLLSSGKYIALSPAISPDGKKIAFEEYASGAIYVMDIK